MLADYGIEERSGLKEADLVDAATRRTGYFKNNSHAFFVVLEDLLQAMDNAWSYKTGTAVHLDIVACATRSKWGDLDEDKRNAFRDNCREHFLKTLGELRDGTWLILDGKTVGESVEGDGMGLDGARARVVVDGYRSLKVQYGRFTSQKKTFPFFGWNWFLNNCNGPIPLGILRVWRAQRDKIISAIG